MRHRTSFIALLAVLALLTAGCGGDDDRAPDSAGGDAAVDASTESGDDAGDNGPDDGDDTEGEGEAESAPDTDEEPERESGETTEDGDDTQEPSELGPQRIVSIDPSGTEILFAIGAGARVVAVDSLSTFPEGTPVTDLSAFTPNVESILAYEPDLVVMGFYEEVQIGLESAGVTVANSFAPQSFDDLYAQFATIAAATGDEAQAETIVAEMRQAIETAIAGAPDASGVRFYHELDNTLYSVTSSTFIGAVYAAFGLDNVADPADADGSSFGYPQLSDEYLVDADPDLIFLADTLCCGQSAVTIAERPGWEQLSAVRNGAVIELNDDVVSRWGPRIVDFVEAVAAAIEAVA